MLISNEFGAIVNVVEEGDVRKICVQPDCKKEFIISKNEREWLKNNGLVEFKRCPECRKKRREAKNG